jgi:hypothetical protein
MSRRQAITFGSTASARASARAAVLASGEVCARAPCTDTQASTDASMAEA